MRIQVNQIHMQSRRVVGDMPYMLVMYISNRLIATMLQDVRLDLLREEADKVALGNLPRHKVSMATFLLTGFELEDSQYVDDLISFKLKSNCLLGTFCVVKPPRQRVSGPANSWQIFKKSGMGYADSYRTGAKYSSPTPPTSPR